MTLTLRKGLLKPALLNFSSYRIYTQKEVNRLQQILFYKLLEVSLKAIQKIITSPAFDEFKALKDYFIKLSKQKEQLEILINNVRKTIISKEKGTTMSDREKFTGFKKKLIEENELKYSQEMRELYEEETIEQSNERLKNMTKIEHEDMKI